MCKMLMLNREMAALAGQRQLCGSWFDHSSQRRAFAACSQAVLIKARPTVWAGSWSSYRRRAHADALQAQARVCHEICNFELEASTQPGCLDAQASQKGRVSFADRLCSLKRAKALARRGLFCLQELHEAPTRFFSLPSPRGHLCSGHQSHIC